MFRNPYPAISLLLFATLLCAVAVVHGFVTVHIRDSYCGGYYDPLYMTIHIYLSKKCLTRVYGDLQLDVDYCWPLSIAVHETTHLVLDHVLRSGWDLPIPDEEAVVEFISLVVMYKHFSRKCAVAIAYTRLKSYVDELLDNVAYCLQMGSELGLDWTSRCLDDALKITGYELGAWWFADWVTSGKLPPVDGIYWLLQEAEAHLGLYRKVINTVLKYVEKLRTR